MHRTYCPPRELMLRRLHWQGELSRFWVLLCLLPMLWMGVLSPALHAHELRVLSPAFQAGRNLCDVASGAEFSGVHQAKNALAVLGRDGACLENGHPELCPLCQWASLDVACLFAAAVFSTPPSRVLPCSWSRVRFRLERALTLRARAPPL